LVLVLVAVAALGASAYYAIRAVVLDIQARATRAAERMRVTTLSYGVGPRSDVARMRIELGRAIFEARRVVVAGRQAGWSLGDAPSLVNRLAVAADGVDAELRALEAERDPGRLETMLPAARERVASVVDPAVALRLALVERARQMDAADLAALRRDCDIEAQALRATPPG
jgi:hypothetical protein